MKDSNKAEITTSSQLDRGQKGSALIARYLERLKFRTMRDAFDMGDFGTEPKPGEVRKTYRSFGFPMRDAIQRLQLEYDLDDEFECRAADLIFCFLEVWEKSVAYDGGLLLNPRIRSRIAHKCGQDLLKSFLAELKKAFRQSVQK